MLFFASGAEQPGVLRSTGVTPLPRYYGPLRLLTRPMGGFGFRLPPPQLRADTPPHRIRSPELRSPSVPTCRPDDPVAAPGPHMPVAWSRGGSLRDVHKRSAREETVSRLIWVHWCYGLPVRTAAFATACPNVLERPGRPGTPRRVLQAEQAIAWEAPFILQESEHLGSAYVHVRIISCRLLA